jgi:hypothetical protein
LIYAAIAVESLIAVAALGLGWLVGVRTTDSLLWSPSDAAFGLFAAAVLFLALVAGWRLSFPPVAHLREVAEQLIVPLFRHSRLWQLGLLSIAAGFGEELLFRGLIQQGLAERIGGVPGTVIAVTVATVLFGLAHYVTHTYALLAGLVGLFFSGLILYFENLLVPIVAHAAYDFAALVFLLWRDRRMQASFAETAAEEETEEETDEAADEETDEETAANDATATADSLDRSVERECIGDLVDAHAPVDTTGSLDAPAGRSRPALPVHARFRTGGSPAVLVGTCGPRGASSPAPWPK